MKRSCSIVILYILIQYSWVAFFFCEIHFSLPEDQFCVPNSFFSLKEEWIMSRSWDWQLFFKHEMKLMGKRSNRIYNAAFYAIAFALLCFQIFALSSLSYFMHSIMQYFDRIFRCILRTPMLPVFTLLFFFLLILNCYLWWLFNDSDSGKCTVHENLRV